MFRHLLSTGIFVTLNLVVLAQTPITSPDVPTPTDGVQCITTPNSDVKDVLNLYEKLTGRRVILKQTTKGAIEIDIAKKVPKEEAVRIIETALLKNGIALIPTKKKDVWKAFPVGRFPGKSAPIYSKEDQLPKTEQVFSFLFELKYADPTKVAQTLGETFAQDADTDDIDFVALPKAGAVLVTAKTSIMRQVIKAVQRLDQRESTGTH